MKNIILTIAIAFCTTNISYGTSALKNNIVGKWKRDDRTIKISSISNDYILLKICAKNVYKQRQECNPVFEQRLEYHSNLGGYYSNQSGKICPYYLKLSENTKLIRSTDPYNDYPDKCQYPDLTFTRVDITN